MEKKKTLEKEISSVCKVPNLLSILIAIVYMLITVRIQMNQIVPMIVTGVIVYLIAEFVIIPFSCGSITKDVSEEFEMGQKGAGSEMERTVLLKKVMSLPERMGLKTFGIAFGAGIVWIVITTLLFHINAEAIIMGIAAIFMGCYTGFVLVISRTQKACSSFAAELVSKGVNKEEVEEKHYFGTLSAKITAFHIFVPILLINVYFMVMCWRLMENPGVESNLSIVIKYVIIVAVNLVFYCYLSTALFNRMMKSINQMSEILGAINKNNMNKVAATSTDLSNEFMYNVYLINTITDLLQSILKMSSRISMEVVESSNELSVISKETAVTSLEQASGIKELLSAMEESDALARNISDKISEVSLVAKKNTEDINGGFDILRQNMQKLEEIKQANDITVDGIQTLTEKISGISDIAGIINSIADQTNIIAFNAELEASSAGETGDNFHNVANEIRRLTNNTIQSTNEIRERITEIQHSSEMLLASSKQGSEKIISGNELINSLHESFTELQTSSESTDSAATEIKQIIVQQTASFEQIVITLRQIAEAAENFSVSTHKISSSAENLCSISQELKKFQPEEITGQEDIDAIIASQNARVLREEATDVTNAIQNDDLSAISEDISMEVKNV